MVVLVGLFGLLCVGFGVSVTQKYRVQKDRVHTLEGQLGAGRKEVLKIPELVENLGKIEAEKKEAEEKLTTFASEKDDLAAKAAELQKEVDTFGAIKVAVGVQIGGLQKTITQQQNRLIDIEEEKEKLAEQLASLEEESSEITEKSELRIADMKRAQEELRNQLNYYTEAKKIADQELAEKQKSLAELQKAKEELEQELARLKEEQGVSKQPEEQQDSTTTPHFPLMDTSAGAASEELNKAFALLRERITSPTINLSEVSILLSRIESTLKNFK